MPGTAGLLGALFGWLLLPLLLLDARHFWLPDRLSALLAVVGLLFAGILFDAALLDRWIGAVAGGAALAFLAWAYRRTRGAERSEEHTSELQSLMRSSYAVFCLKKKKQ